MIVILVIFFLFLTSCVNPYARFYEGTPDARILRGYDSTAGSSLQIFRTENFERDGRALIRKGYQPIGRAAFNIAQNRIAEWHLKQHAQQVGAHVVLVASRYTHTVSGAVPLFVPRTATAYSNSTVTAYGGGSSVTAYGTGTTTIYGTQTIMMPYSVAHSDVAALFFAKSQPRLGIYPAPLDDETRKRLQTNFGVKVIELMEGSPAFEANVLPGDVLLSFHGEAVQSVDHFVKLVNKYEGSSVGLKFDRDGKAFEKNLEIRATDTLARLDSDSGRGLEEFFVQQTQQEQQQPLNSSSSPIATAPPNPPSMAPPREVQANNPPVPAPIIPRKEAPTKSYASLVQYDGPRVKSGVTLDAEFVDDGSGSGEGVVSYPGGRNLLKGKWITLPAGKVEAPKLIDKRALNALRLAADVPLTISRFTDGETVLECLHGETAALSQRKGECQDNFGNKYHLVFRP